MKLEWLNATVESFLLVSFFISNLCDTDCLKI